MASRYDTRKTRYVVLPGRGIVGPSMQAAVFKDGPRPDLARAITTRFSDFGGASRNTLLAEAASPGADLAAAVEDDDFRVLSQRFEDGPAIVKMTQAARLAFEAGNPTLRVLPITRYYLPGRGPHRARTAAAGKHPAAKSAVQDSGTVFLADVKQHVLGGLAAGGGEGRGVTVGVVDTGVDNKHPALATNVSLLRCVVPGADPHGGGPVDWGASEAAMAGHGTHVAGIIAAEAGHGGPAGVAPQARIASYRVFADNPKGLTGAENAAIIDALRFAIEDGCHVVNLSIEGPAMREDGVRIAINDAWNQGVLCVAAAGNGFGRSVSYPAALPRCVAVTAIGREGCFPDDPSFRSFVSDQRAGADPAIFLATFSNYGPSVQFTAPGHAIVSTFPGGEWWFDSGTSMAAPFVCGMLARVLSANTNILNMTADAERSAAMLQMLVGRAKVLALPQAAQEGYGLPA